VPDEGGIEIEILGSFVPSLRAIVTLDGANCPLPSVMGGSDVSNQIGQGPFPIASSDGTTIRCVVPQLPIGWQDLTVTQPGYPALTLASAVEVVRRDFHTRLHTLRASFPTPPFPPLAVGPKQLRLEGRYSQVTSAGQPVPVQQGLIQALAGALLEASSIRYTRLTTAPWRSGSVVQISSSAPGDVGRTVTIYGLDVAGRTQTETLTLNGVVVVAGTRTWSSVDKAEIEWSAGGLSGPGWCTGLLTIRDDASTPPERIVIRPGFTEKLAGQVQPGDLGCIVDGNFGFPTAGTLALNGEQIAYNSKNTDSVCNWFTFSGAATVDHAPGETVADASLISSALELGRAALLPGTAEGHYLDGATRRFGGIERPPALADSAFRALYGALAYGPHGTIHGLELVLTAVLGAGGYTILEDLVSFTEALSAGAAARTASAQAGYPCVVWIDWGTLLSLAAGNQGRAYLCGGEPQTSSDVTHVTPDHPPLVPYGVYTQADVAAGLGRGNNYCDLIGTADGSVGAPGVTVTSGAALFPVDIVGKPFTIEGSTTKNNGVYRVASRPAANTVTLEGQPRKYGYVYPGALTIFSLDASWPGASGPFGPSCVGKTIRVFDTMAGAPVSRVVSRYIDSLHVEVSVAWPAGCSGAGWCFWPTLEVDAGFNWKAPLATVALGAIVLPRVLPGAATAVLVDYVAAFSAEVSLDATVSHVPPTQARPFYLSGLDQWLIDLLEDLVPAGVRIALGSPP
jgi:hypothetical protein